jgi:hypothetical protein
MKELSVAFALSVPHEETKRIRDDVGFFQAVRTALGRKSSGRKLTEDEMDLAIKQIVGAFKLEVQQSGRRPQTVFCSRDISSAGC